MKAYPFLLLLACFFIACDDTPTVSPPATCGWETPAPTTLNCNALTAEWIQEKSLEYINEIRALGCDCGGEAMSAAAALEWNDALEAAAQRHSDDMANSGTLSHTGSDGSTPGERIEAENFTTSSWAENIGHGQESIEAIMEAWLESAGHCSAMMGSSYTKVGIAHNGCYWTMVVAE